MRIIGGELRGRRIAAPTGRRTRPMLDRVREALFSSLTPWLPGAHVLDLFAGSGSLGLEALSRGAASARLVERDPQAARLLEGNVSELTLATRAVVVRGDALSPSSWGEEEPDVVFLDPPYALLEDPATRAALLRTLAVLVGERLSAAGRLIFHTPRGAVLESELPAGVATQARRYGTNELWYVARAEAPA